MSLENTFVNLLPDLSELTPCGIGDIELSQYWLRQWLIAWRHKAIAWTNPDFSLVRFCGIHHWAISQWMPKLSLISLKLYFNNYDQIPLANELMALLWVFLTEHTVYAIRRFEAWISNHIHYKVWDEITYPFLNFNGANILKMFENVIGSFC